MSGRRGRISSRRLLAEQRRSRALDLRTKQRMSLREIARELDVSHEAVRKMINTELDRHAQANAEKVERMRTEETLALDAMQGAIWAQATQEVDLYMPGDDQLPRNSRGNIDMGALVSMVQAGTDNRIAAINTILRISKRRAMLHGLDMPQRRIIEGGTPIEIDVRHRIVEKLETIRERKLEAGTREAIEAEVIEEAEAV